MIDIKICLPGHPLLLSFLPIGISGSWIIVFLQPMQQRSKNKSFEKGVILKLKTKLIFKEKKNNIRFFFCGFGSVPNFALFLVNFKSYSIDPAFLFDIVEDAKNWHNLPNFCFNTFFNVKLLRDAKLGGPEGLKGSCLMLRARKNNFLASPYFKVLL